jgi:hypothetical protein
MSGRSLANKDLNSYNEYYTNIKHKITNDEQKFQDFMSSNMGIDTISIILHNIPYLNSSSYEKLINFLVKIKYKNNNNWITILKEYLRCLDILNKHYQPLSNKHVAQILSYLKDMYKYLPYSTENELLELLDKSISGSIAYLMNNLHDMYPENFVLLINSLSKLGLMDESNSKIIEKVLTERLQDIPYALFCNILYSIFRTRSASESFNLKLEKITNFILDDFLSNKAEIDPFVITMIAKCKFKY